MLVITKSGSHWVFNNGRVTNLRHGIYREPILGIVKTLDDGRLAFNLRQGPVTTAPVVERHWV